MGDYSNYEANGYVIIKNYLKERQIKELIKLKQNFCFDNSNPHVSEKVWMNCSTIRFKKFHQICLNILFTANSFVPWFKKFQNIEEIISKRNPFFRFNFYSSNTKNNFAVHYDGIENDSAMIFLTEFGLDYHGGLYILDRHKPSNPILIVQFCKKGDLLVFDANRFIHWVDIQTLKAGGRLTLMGAFSPEYRYGSLSAENLQSWQKLGFQIRNKLFLFVKSLKNKNQ